MRCPQCHTELPEGARFCFQCGAPQPAAAATQEDSLLLDLDKALDPQLTGLFLKTLNKQVEEQQPGADPAAYAEHFYQSGFRDMLYRRQHQLKSKLERQQQEGATAAAINRIVELELLELLDYFIIHYCKHLNTSPLPEAILRYQGLGRYEIDLSAMVFSYLDFESEPNERVYTDLIKMPVDKLKNAGKFFLFPEQREERIFFICDQSLLGSCKEGFAMTDQALYWKAHLQTARRIRYRGPLEVQREKGWLLINGEFFNANPRLNIRMMKLLRKLARL